MINHRVEAAPLDDNPAPKKRTIDLGETPEETSEWNIIKAMVKRGGSKSIKPVGKRILSVHDKLPKNNPKVFEVQINGTRYAIVKIISLG